MLRLQADKIFCYSLTVISTLFSLCCFSIELHMVWHSVSLQYFPGGSYRVIIFCLLLLTFYLMNNKNNPTSVHLLLFCVYAPSSQTPSRSWQMATCTEPSSAGGFLLSKGSFSSPLLLHANLVRGIAVRGIATESYVFLNWFFSHSYQGKEKNTESMCRKIKKTGIISNQMLAKGWVLKSTIHKWKNKNITLPL